MVPPQKSEIWFKKSHYIYWISTPKISQVSWTLHRADARCNNKNLVSAKALKVGDGALLKTIKMRRLKSKMKRLQWFSDATTHQCCYEWALRVTGWITWSPRQQTLVLVFSSYASLTGWHLAAPDGFSYKSRSTAVFQCSLHFNIDDQQHFES